MKNDYYANRRTLQILGADLDRELLDVTFALFIVVEEYLKSRS